jgi:hypothetical protein
MASTVPMKPLKLVEAPGLEPEGIFGFLDPTPRTCRPIRFRPPTRGAGFRLGGGGFAFGFASADPRDIGFIGNKPFDPNVMGLRCEALFG